MPGYDTIARGYAARWYGAVAQARRLSQPLRRPLRPRRLACDLPGTSAMAADAMVFLALAARSVTNRAACGLGRATREALHNRASKTGMDAAGSASTC